MNSKTQDSAVVNRNNIQNELEDLHVGDMAFPPNIRNSSCSDRVVGVHDNMNGNVENDWHPLHSGTTDQLEVGQTESGCVVENMQINDWLFLYDQKECISPFDKFRDEIYVVDEGEAVVIPQFRAAKAVSDSSLCNLWEDEKNDGS